MPAGEIEPALARIFVYGTLRRGRSHHRMLENCRYCGKTSVTGSLFSLGAYPALVLGGTGAVHGEIWEVPGDLLCRLDRYEGVEEDLFQRVAVIAVTGEPLWTYVAGSALANAIANASPVPGGEWPPPGSEPPNSPRVP